jgi:Matrixin
MPFERAGFGGGMRHLIALLGVMASTACSSSSQHLDYKVLIDPAFLAAEADAITAGLSDWAETVPELHISPVIARCDVPSGQQICVHPAFDAPDLSNDVIGHTAAGESDDATVWIYVTRIQASGQDVPSLMQQTMAHELGHAMGLSHSPSGELMAPEVPAQAHRVTSADVAQFWSVRRN